MTYYYHCNSSATTPFYAHLVPVVPHTIPSIPLCIFHVLIHNNFNSFASHDPQNPCHAMSIEIIIEENNDVVLHIPHKTPLFLPQLWPRQDKTRIHLTPCLQTRTKNLRLTFALHACKRSSYPAIWWCDLLRGVRAAMDRRDEVVLLKSSHVSYSEYGSCDVICRVLVSTYCVLDTREVI